MLIKLKESFAEGVERFKWYASIISERIKVEFAVIKLLRECADIEKRVAELERTIGRRIFDLRQARGVDIYGDRAVLEALHQIEELELELGSVRARVSMVQEPVE